MKTIDVVLVDASDREIGLMEKLEAHEKGLLHRAFSVFIYNSEGNMLLQQRADKKYHSGGLWTNACCSHPLPDENVAHAAGRRLLEEMGLTAELEPSFSFIYNARLDNGLVEHEYDHVFVGICNEVPDINPDEVKSFRWMSDEEILREINSSPHNFTAWFHIAFRMLMERKSKALIPC
jgi:isopentenyl-diphosphate delta-isomerase